MSIVVDPTVPGNAEAESLGASRIRNVTGWLLSLFGQSATMVYTFVTNPFGIDANNLITVSADPISALGIATKRYVDSGSGSSATITNSGSGSAFTGNLSPAITSYVTFAQYVLGWTQASQGNDTVALNGLAALTVKKNSGGALVNLAAGDIPAGSVTVVVYDGTNLEVVSPVGGSSVGVAVLSTPGSGNWTIPLGVTAIIAEIYGAGGGSWNSGFAVGGDGAYVKMALSGLTPGGTIPYVVGAGGATGAPGTAGGVSTFNSISANGGGAATSSSSGGTEGALQQAPGAGTIEQGISAPSGTAAGRTFVRGGANNAAGENGMIVIQW